MVGRRENPLVVETEILHFLFNLLLSQYHYFQRWGILKEPFKEGTITQRVTGHHAHAACFLTTSVTFDDV